MSDIAQLVERIEALEAAAEGASYAITLVIGRLSEDQRQGLSDDLEPMRRRLAAERPRAGQLWPEPGLRALARGVALVEEALEGGDPFEG